MRAWTAILVVLAACGEGPAKKNPEIVQTVARVTFSNVEGDHWVLEAENGRDYLPQQALPLELQIDGARVEVALVERLDLISPAPGTVADIVSIAAFACGATCGAMPPPITLTITNAATSGPVAGVTILNLGGPTAAPYGPPTAGCGSTAYSSSCAINGGVGAYFFDVAAPGFQSKHLDVVVPAWQHVPGICCEPEYQSQQFVVALMPF